MSIEAMKLALEAFTEIADETYDSGTNGAKAQRIAQAMILKVGEALAQPAPVQEPAESPDDWSDWKVTPPAAQRQWVGLTDEEIVLIVAECAASHQHTDIHFAKAIEAKLKEKNT